MCHSILALKNIVEKLSDTDKGSVQNSEEELKNLHSRDHGCNVENVMSKIKDFIATLYANAVNPCSHVSDILHCIYDDDLCEDYRSYIKMCEMDYHKHITIIDNDMLTQIEKKEKNLTSKKKWISPEDTKSSSKCVSLLETQQQQPKDFTLSLQQIILYSDGDSFSQALLVTIDNNANNRK